MNTALDPMRQFIIDNPGVNLSTTTSDWPAASSLYLTNGWSLLDDINGMNSYIYDGVQINDTSVGLNAWAQFWVNDLWSEMDVSRTVHHIHSALFTDRLVHNLNRSLM